MKKLTILFAALTLSVGLWAIDGVKYIDATGQEQTANGVTEITDASDQVTWTAGWYVVKGADVQLAKGAVCNGAVHLILADGAKLTATGETDKAGIQVSGGASLTIYGQTAQSGQLEANGGKYAAGIGGEREGNGSNITINGGTVTATGGDDGAGIGGGDYGNGSDITINGGVVTATGKGYAAGIGGGESGNGSNITITGGNVTATSGNRGAGIGGGYKGNGSYITITGGKVTATCEEDNGAGIGGGDEGDGTNITINGGNVTANGGEFAAGIGGGSMRSGSNITITGGTVTANGGYIGAGIGGGNNVSGSDINITGGNVTANGGENGFGFGDGEGSPNISVATNLVVKAGDDYPLQEIEDHGDNLRYEITHKRYATIKDPNAKITLTASDFTVTKDGDWKYDKTEKRVKVEFISVENPGPPADKVEIYYNNDKMVKPIEPGTYQVYIDIRETDTYAAVTGITSEEWKFDIIDREGAYSAINEAIAAAQDAINTVANGYENVQEVMAYIDAAEAQFEEIKNEAAETIGNATDQSTITEAKDNAISEIAKIEASAKTNIQAAIASLQQNAINDIQAVADAAKEEIDGLGVDESAKSEAKADIDNIVNTAEQTINAAPSKDAIDNAKTEAIAKIHDVVQTTKNMWVTVREDGVVGDWSTICMEHNITAIDGATFWTIVGQDANSFVLDEVTEPQAGYGYLIRFTAAELKVKFGGGLPVLDPVTATPEHPIQGTFEQIDFDPTTGENKLVGNYVVYQNLLCMVEGWVGLYDHRAYVVANLVPWNVPAPAPGRARAYMPKPKETPTELEPIDGSQCTMHNGKFLRKGQLIIVKDGKRYNALGF